MRLANNVTIVTSGGIGIGAAIARLFAQEGARVTITGRRQEVLAHMVDAIAQSGGHALGMPEDTARAAAYFASDESLWTTGSVLTVDGGVMAQ